jgi:hypothetical protein
LFFRKPGKPGSHLLSANRDHDYSAKKRGNDSEMAPQAVEIAQNGLGNDGPPLAVVVKQLGGAPG